MHAEVLIEGYCVLLCAHNGASFLAEQLQSIVDQEVQPARVIFFDDGSVDETSAVAQQFCVSLPLEIVHLTKHRPGAAGAFDAILSYSAQSSDAFSAYVLCDQDDIWEPYKARRLMEELALIPAKTPALIHSELKCFGPASGGKTYLHDSLGHQIFESTPDAPLMTLLFENVVVGASTAFNRELLIRAVPMPLGAFMHDWWLAIVCVAHGGVIRYLSEALTHYRIHNNSTVGQSGHFLHALPKRLKALSHSWRDPWLKTVRDQFLALPFDPIHLPSDRFQPLLQFGQQLFSRQFSWTERYSAWQKLRSHRIWAVSSKDAYYKARLFTDYVV